MGAKRRMATAAVALLAAIGLAAVARAAPLTVRIGWVLTPGHIAPLIEALGKREPAVFRHFGEFNAINADLSLIEEAKRRSTASRKMDAAAQIVIDRVSHVYRPPRGRPVTALDNVSLDVRDPRVRCIAGSQRLRQEHAPLPGRRVLARGARRDLCRRRADRRSRPRPRHRLSTFRAVS